MARIQWNPIAIPDIGTSAVAAQAQAGRSIQDAFAGLNGVLNQWEGSRRDANVAELFTRQNAFVGRDPAEYEAALRSGALTQGLTYLRPEQLQAARSYAGELTRDYRGDIAWEDGREDRRFTVDTRNRGETERVAMNDATRNLMPVWQEAQRTGDRAAILAATAEAARLNPGLNSSQITALMNQGNQAVEQFQGDQTYSRGVRNSDFDYNNRVQDREWLTEDRATNEQALALSEEYVRYGGTVDDLMADPRYASATPAVQAASRARLASSTGGGASGGAGSYSGPADMGAPQTAVASVLSNSGLSPVVVAGFLGNFEVEGGYGGAQGDRGSDRSRADGGSASGIAQWRGSRRDEFVRRVGKQPHEASHAEQAAFVAWELTTPEGRRAAGISEANANRILNARDPGEAAALIDQFYERSDGTHRDRRIAAANRYGSSPAQVQGAATDLAVGASVARASDPNGPQARNIFTALNDDTPDREVIAALVTPAGEDGPGGPFAGMDRGRVGRMIREVQDRYARQNGGTGRLPAAAAAQILLGSTRPFDGIKDFFGNITGGSSAVGSTGGLFATATDTVNWRDVDSRLQRLRVENGSIPLAADVRNEENRQGIIVGSQQGREQLTALRAELAAAQQRDLERGIRNNPVTERLAQRVAVLTQQWGSFTGGSQEILRANGQ